VHSGSAVILARRKRERKREILAEYREGEKDCFFGNSKDENEMVRVEGGCPFRRKEGKPSWCGEKRSILTKITNKKVPPQGGW